jgi:putative transcriptional regulator
VSDSLAGRLLIAEPMMGDDNFDRAVVLMLEHNEHGALGLVINRPSDLEVRDLVPEWSDLTIDPEVIFVGGPVSQTGVIALARRPASAGYETVTGWSQVIGSCGTLDLNIGSGSVLGSIDGVRLFAGYSGWSAGQLEGELELGAWFVVDALPDDAFAAMPERLWRDVLRRQPDELNLLADFPPHPSLN